MFGARLQAARRGQGLTQAQLAAHLGVTQQAVAKWEAGNALPQPGLLLALSRALCVSAEYLLGDAGGPALIPVLGDVRAGFGADAIENPLGYESFDTADPGQYFCLAVRGDSMEPRIREGDIALVRRQPTLESGQLGVFLYGDGEGTLKRYRKIPGGARLEAFNPACAAAEFIGGDLAGLSILGRVVQTRASW